MWGLGERCGHIALEARCENKKLPHVCAADSCRTGAQQIYNNWIQKTLPRAFVENVLDPGTVKLADAGSAVNQLSEVIGVMST